MMLGSAQNRTDSSTCHVDLHCTLGLKRKTHFPYHKQKNSKNSDALGARCTRQSHCWQNFNFLGQMSAFSEPSPPCRKQASRNAGKKARLHPIIVRSNIFFFPSFYHLLIFFKISLVVVVSLEDEQEMSAKGLLTFLACFNIGNHNQAHVSLLY